MGLREIGGGEWINPKELDEGEIALEKGVFKGFAENDNGTFCQFKDESGTTVNIGGKTLISACEQIDIGDTVQVKFEGTVKFKNGRKGSMWKLFLYEEEDDGSDSSVSDESESEVEEEPKKKTTKKAAKKTAKKATKKAAKKKEVEEEEDDMDDLDNLE